MCVVGYVIMMLLISMGFWLVGYNEGCKDTEKLYKSNIYENSVEREGK